ncbi:DUF2332 domain-containing protein [Nocardioides sp. zg-DK7169]|uniref:DUF2332 domain-containing protein n=1 Tax=Nocardioides sp. zg-DK7169 TaxID=2736600 RepID=UPI0015575451|nr:DUF2332 domain-containing protein [Nocardioides sp. zg-DK7169]NPC97195.1 DUF2332 domain-containing protein [Nocardioides sp. zg-DK7169]
MEPFMDPAEQYAMFATDARDSPCFSEWAAAVARDEEVLAWLATLPPIKQQPNLVFAAARWHGVPAPGPYDALRSALLDDDGTIRETILSRSTQTNEAGRMATLLPAITSLGLEGPISLLEVGASAGLCLYPDRWGYAWRTEAGEVRLGGEPRLTCAVRGALPPLPDRLPEVAWRGGLDLNPGDVTDEDAMAWLENLVWPEQDERRERLRHAIAIARAEPPRLVRGDLLSDLPDLLEVAAGQGPVVVFHSAVVAYLEPEGRERFHDLMTGLVADGACHWVSNEGKGVLPRITETGPPVPEGHPTFVTGVDGRAVAWTHGHGRSLRWVAGS